MNNNIKPSIFISAKLLFISILDIYLSGTVLGAMGYIGFIIMLLNVFFVPVIFVSTLCSFCKDSKSNKRDKVFIIILACILLIASLVCFVLTTNRPGDMWYLYFKIMSTLLCGGLVVWHKIFLNTIKKTETCNFIFIIEAVLLLLLNAFARQCGFQTSRLFFHFEMLIPIGVLCVFSYYLGREMIKRDFVIKMWLWFVGVFASVFVWTASLGTPYQLPVKNGISMVLWIVPSLVIIFFCWVGLISVHISERKKVITE